jgi:arylformamidase
LFLWDISPPVHAGLAGVPRRHALPQQLGRALAPGCPVNVSSITLSPHVGAHADAPLHYDPQGESVDRRRRPRRPTWALAA